VSVTATSWLLATFLTFADMLLGSHTAYDY
jgi:hypothetical protein